jgi:hypothetical protein
MRLRTLAEQRSQSLAICSNLLQMAPNLCSRPIEHGKPLAHLAATLCRHKNLKEVRSEKEMIVPRRPPPGYLPLLTIVRFDDPQKRHQVGAIQDFLDLRRQFPTRQSGEHSVIDTNCAGCIATGAPLPSRRVDQPLDFSRKLALGRGISAGSHRRGRSRRL